MNTTVFLFLNFFRLFTVLKNAIETLIKRHVLSFPKFTSIKGDKLNGDFVFLKMCTFVGRYGFFFIS